MDTEVNENSKKKLKKKQCCHTAVERQAHNMQPTELLVVAHIKLQIKYNDWKIIKIDK